MTGRPMMSLERKRDCKRCQERWSFIYVVWGSEDEVICEHQDAYLEGLELVDKHLPL